VPEAYSAFGGWRAFSAAELSRLWASPVYALCPSRRRSPLATWGFFSPASPLGWAPSALPWAASGRRPRLFSLGLFFLGLGNRGRGRLGRRVLLSTRTLKLGEHILVSRSSISYCPGRGWTVRGDLPLVERHVELRLELVGNHSRGDGAEHLAVFAGLTVMRQRSLERLLANSFMVLNSWASRSARRWRSTSRRRLLAAVSGMPGPAEEIVAGVGRRRL